MKHTEKAFTCDSLSIAVSGWFFFFNALFHNFIFHLNKNVMGETSGKRKAICLSLLSYSFLLIHLGIFFPSEIAFCMPEYTSLFFCLTQSNHSGLQTSHVIASTCHRKGNTVLLGHIVLLKITHILSSKGTIQKF